MTDPDPDPILEASALDFRWRASDPFLFCVHHLDRYPAASPAEAMGPDERALQGRQLGQDFSGEQGWSMYHGARVPGFPAHPHRGFETITIVERGVIDHSDSLGATARFGAGDVQWMTAGQGIVHSEMFPLLHADRENPLELFQIWLNLPARSKLVRPHFSMLWSEQVGRVELNPGARARVIAGALHGVRAPQAPPHSWASQEEHGVQIWRLELEPGARLALPAHEPGLNRTLFVYDGADGVHVAGRRLGGATGLRLKSEIEVEVRHEGALSEAKMLLLQGKPLGEPVAQHGPFVMNTRAELAEAFSDFQRTRFGTWPFESEAPVHPRHQARFARHADGRLEEP